MLLMNFCLFYVVFWDYICLFWQVCSGGFGFFVWKLIDGGDSWECLGEIVESGFLVVKGKISVLIFFDLNCVFVLIEVDLGGGFYCFDDGGKIWRNVNIDWGL